MRRVTRLERARGYTVAILAVVLCAVVRWLLDDLVTLTFVTFYPAILVGAWWGGRGAALLAVVLSAAVGEYWWTPPRGSFLAADPRHYANVLLFMGVGSMLGLVTARLRRVQSRFHSVLQAINDGFAVIDREWRFIYANPALAALIKRQPRELIGKRVWDIFPDAEHGEFGDAARRAMHGTPSEYTAFNQHLGVWIHATVYPVPEGIAAISQDVTAARELEARRSDLIAHLEATNRLKDDFLATLSHEMRTPLNALMGWTAILEQQASPAPRAIRSILTNAKALKELVEELLDSSRIVSGKLHMDMQATDFAHVVGEAVDTLRNTFDGRHLTLAVAGHDQPCWVMGDAGRLRQAVLNVLGNAVKFTPPPGSIDVRLWTDKETATLTVRDTGVGIPSDVLPNIFERFVQGDRRPPAATRGLGLGLAITKHVIEAHGGRVYAESEGPLKGTVLTISLPLIAALATPASADSTVPPAMV